MISLLVRPALLLAVAALVAHPAPAEERAPGGAGEGPKVRVLEPEEGRPVAGETLLRAGVDLGSAPLERVVFRIDGRVVGAREAPPWEVTWGASLDYSDYLLEVTAIDTEGRTSTAKRSIPPILLREHVTVLDTPIQEIRLSATVTDRSGNAVSGLEPDDFVVIENGRPQTLSDFGREGQRTDRPLSVLLVIDRSASMRVHLGDLAEAVRSLLGALRPGDEVGVATVVNGEFDVSQPFIGADGVIEPDLERMPFAAGGSPLFDAIDRGLLLMRDRRGRRVILALTDGWDDRLRLNVNFFQSNYLLDLARRAQRSSTQITMIWPGPPSQGRLAIESLVDETGGLIYYVSGDMPGLLARIAHDLKEQYYLAYYSDDSTRDGRRRRIEVQVAQPDLRVRTIGGFFALPPQVQVLRSDLKAKDPATRAEAARALAYLDTPDALKLLRAALRDRAPEVRSAAARGLGVRRDLEAASLLARTLDDDSTIVRTSAYDALLGLGQPTTHELLARLPGAKGLSCVLLLRLLGEVGDERALEPMTERLAAERPEERAAAVAALGSLGLSGGLAPLDAVLADPDRRVRMEAIRAVAEIGGMEAVTILEKYGGREPDANLRHLAADALATVLRSIRGS